MRWHKHFLIVAAVVVVAATTTVVAFGAPRRTTPGHPHPHGAGKADELRLALTPSSTALAACMPGAELNVKVKLTSEERGFDRFDISAHHLAPNRDYTIFLLEQAGAPFGAAEYIGDFSTNAGGNGHNKLKLIVQEAFSSTLVSGTRVRVDLN